MLFFIPEKFNFIGIDGLDILKECRTKNIGIQFKFNKSFPDYFIIRANLFSLNTTPIINIFKKSAESFIHNHTRNSYPIFIDRTRLNAYEIVKVVEVKAHNSDTGRRMLKNYKSFECFEFIGDNQGDFYSISNKKDSQGLKDYKLISFFQAVPFLRPLALKL